MDATEDAAEGETDDLTPEQEEGYERFTLAAQKALYEDGMAEDIGVRMQKAANAATEMANVAYELVAAIDERSGGMLDDEMLAPVALDILGMVAEIARAAEVKVTGADVATAAKTMISRYLQENGASEEEVTQMVSGIDPNAAGASIDQEFGG